MSRRWNRTVRLRIGAGAVKASVHGGWPRAVTIAEIDRTVTASAAPATDPAPHAPAIEAVLAELGSRVAIEGARLEVHVGSSLLHLDVVEGDFGAHTDRQLQGIATACVSELLGEEAAARTVRWHLQRDERHLLIVALADAWIELLRTVATTARLRLAGVEPVFLSRWNQARRSVKARDGVFVVSAADDLAIAAVSDGAIAAISVGRGVDLRVEAPRQPSGRERSDRVVSSGFSPDLQGMATVDERVDRFLSARGQDPEQQSAFVLVATDRASVAASSRWVVVGSPELRT